MSIVFFLLYLFGIFLLLFSKYPTCKNGRTVISRKYNVPKTNVIAVAMLQIIVSIVVGLLCATRNVKSYDTIVYINWYEKIQNLALFAADGTYGFLFELFAKFVARLLCAGYPLFFFLIAIFNLTTVYVTIMKEKVYKNTALISYVLYIAFIGFYYSFIVLRQGLAITMVIAAYCVLDKSRKNALLLCFLGTLFHESAWIAFFCILTLYSRKFILKRRMALFMILLAFFFYITHFTTIFVFPVLNALLNILNKIDSFTFHKYILYFEENILSNKISLLYVLYYLITFGLVYFRYKNRDSKTIKMKEEFFLLLNILGLTIVGFFSAAGAIVRLTEYLVSCTYIFLIPECLNIITSRNNSKFIVAIIIFILTYLHLRIILGPVDFIF